MLSLIELSKSHTDLELYGTDTSIAPIDKVHIIDEDSFEQFTLEWLFGCKKMKYSFIKRIGGAGDKGRDVVAIITMVQWTIINVNTIIQGFLLNFRYIL